MAGQDDDHATSCQTAAFSIGLLALQYVTRDSKRWASFNAECEQARGTGIRISRDDALHLAAVLSDGMQLSSAMDKIMGDRRRGEHG